MANDSASAAPDGQRATYESWKRHQQEEDALMTFSRQAGVSFLELQRLFKEADAFAGLTAAQRQEVILASTVQHFREGEVVFYELRPGHTFYIILEGQVILSRQIKNQRPLPRVPNPPNARQSPPPHPQPQNSTASTTTPDTLLNSMRPNGPSQSQPPVPSPLLLSTNPGFDEVSNLTATTAASALDSDQASTMTPLRRPLPAAHRARRSTSPDPRRSSSPLLDEDHRHSQPLFNTWSERPSPPSPQRRRKPIAIQVEGARCGGKPIGMNSPPRQPTDSSSASAAAADQARSSGSLPPGRVLKFRPEPLPQLGNGPAPPGSPSTHHHSPEIDDEAFELPKMYRRYTSPAGSLSPSRTAASFQKAAPILPYQHSDAYIVARLGLFQSFGSSSLLHNLPRNASATCASPTTLIVVNADAFATHLKALHLAKLKESASALGRVPVFTSWSQNSLQLLMAYAQEAQYSQGQELVQRGSTADRVIFICSGDVAAFVAPQETLECRTVFQQGPRFVSKEWHVAVLSDGDFFGDIEASCEVAFTFTAVAASNAVACILFAAPDFRFHIAKHWYALKAMMEEGSTPAHLRDMSIAPEAFSQAPERSSSPSRPTRTPIAVTPPAHPSVRGPFGLPGALAPDSALFAGPEKRPASPLKSPVPSSASQQPDQAQQPHPVPLEPAVILGVGLGVGPSPSASDFVMRWKSAAEWQHVRCAHKKELAFDWTTAPKGLIFWHSGGFCVVPEGQSKAFRLVQEPKEPAWADPFDNNRSQRGISSSSRAAARMFENLRGDAQGQGLGLLPHLQHKTKQTGSRTAGADQSRDRWPLSRDPGQGRMTRTAHVDAGDGPDRGMSSPTRLGSPERQLQYSPSKLRVVKSESGTWRLDLPPAPQGNGNEYYVCRSDADVDRKAALRESQWLKPQQESSGERSGEGSGERARSCSPGPRHSRGLGDPQAHSGERSGDRPFSPGPDELSHSDMEHQRPVFAFSKFSKAYASKHGSEFPLPHRDVRDQGVGLTVSFLKM